MTSKTRPESHSVAGSFTRFDPEPEHDGAAIVYGTLWIEGPVGPVSISIRSETMMAKIAGLEADDPVRIDFVPDPANPRRLIPAFIERGLASLS